MRTTLTLDDDVAAALERIRKRHDLRFKDVVNEALRRGIQQMADRPKRRKAYRTQAVSLGRCRVGGIDNVTEVIAIAEGDSHS